MNRRDQITSDAVRIHSYRPMDRAAVIRLNQDGVLRSDCAAGCPTNDFDDVEAVGLYETQNHLWLAKINDQLVGMVGLREQRPHVAVIRRLRVAPEWQGTDICPRLMKMALWHSWLYGAVKVVVDAPCTSDRSIRFLGELGFQCTRTRSERGRDLIEFYPTLYGRPHYAAPGP